MKIVRKFINTKIGEQFKKTAFAQWVKKSFIYQIYLRACGDWRYPFYVIGWEIANFLTMRKHVSVGGVSFSLPNTNWITHFRWFLIKNKEPEVRF